MAERLGNAQNTARRVARFKRFPIGRCWCEALELANNRKLLMRPIEPEDAPALRRSFGLLTSEEIRFRFLHPLNELTPQYANQLSALDGHTAFALLIVELKPPREALIGAVVRAAVDHSGDRAEFAIIVGRQLGGFGLGEYLMKRIIEWCRKKKLKQMYGDVMLENHRMLRLVERLGFKVEKLDQFPSLVRVYLDLNRKNP